MSRLGINTGNTANDGQGDPLRVAMGKINSNFQELYNTLGNGFDLASYVVTAGISTLARNLTGNPIINVSGVLNTGITTTEHLEVRNITSTGIVTAVQFVGDGSQLENVTATWDGVEVLDNNVRRGVAQELNFGNNIEVTAPDGGGRVTISVGSGLTVAYSPTSGVADYALLSGVSTTAGYATTSGYSLLSGVSTTAGYATTSGISTVARGLTGTPNLNVGVVTAVSFIGDGSGLLNVPVTGIITYAQQSALSYGLIGTPSISVYSVGISSNVTISGITSFYNSVHFEDNVTLNIGDNDELQLFHNGADSYIDNSSAGNLIIRDGGTGIQLRRSGGGPTSGLMAAFNNNAGVELYYDSVLKLQTFSGGVAINDSVGIGSTAGNPPYRLTVSGVGATITSGLVDAIADLTSSVNGYGQVNIRNSFAGSNSSGDLVITADTGTDTTNYLDLGINNSSFSSGSWTINGPLDGYLYTSDRNISIGAASAGRYLSLFAGDTLIENEKVRVTEGGVGIGSTQPTSMLAVSGDVSVSGVITATSFSGSGVNLTGVVTSLVGYATEGYVDAAVSGVSTFSGDYNDLINQPSIPSIVGLASEGYVDAVVSVVGSGGTWAVNASGIHTSKNVGIGTELSSSALWVEGNGYFSGVVTATRFESVSAGTPTIDSPNNLNINAVLVAISTDVTIGDELRVAGITTIGPGGIRVAGVVTATSFSGSGSGLTNIPAGQLTGTLPAIDGSALTNLPAASLPANGSFTTLSVSGITTSASFRTNSTVGDGTDVGFAIKYYITANGSSAYRFAGPGVLNTTDDPTIYLHRGFTYIFENSTGGSHPFAIRYSSGGTGYGSTYLSGSQTGTQIFTVPFDAPPTLVYQCTIHGSMLGTFNIVT